MPTSQIPFDSAWSEPALSEPTAIDNVIGPVQSSNGFIQSSAFCSLPLARPALQEQAAGNEVIHVRRRPIPRKGHTKSRRGCFSCKRKKIKCQETRPKCGNCEKTGFMCEYPKSIFDPPATSPILQPQSTPTVFSITDMRFFHHFLVRGYPHLPAGGDSIWTLQIPAYAYEYDFLLRSMLALGASHLTIVTSITADMKARALVHRVEAVKLLNQALSKPAQSKEENDARFAAFLILTGQSSCMADGLFDFLTMLRGCVLQGAYLKILGGTTHFRSFGEHNHLKGISEMDLEAIEPSVLDVAMNSLVDLQPYCEDGVEKIYLSLLVNLVQDLYTSPKAAYPAFIWLYNVVGFISHTDFQHLLNTSNGIAQVLIGHFLALHGMLRPVSVVEQEGRDASAIFQIFDSWISRIHADLDPSIQTLHLWPVSLIQQNSPNDF